MMKRQMIIAASVLLMHAAQASEVSYSSLSNVVREAQWIIKATVIAVESQETTELRRIQYEVAPTAVVMGIPDVPEQALLVYEEVIPAIKDDKGNVVGWASPIYSGSGHEFSIKPGEQWLFLFIANALSDISPTHILRAEPISSESKIKRIMSQPRP